MSVAHARRSIPAIGLGQARECRRYPPHCHVSCFYRTWMPSMLHEGLVLLFRAIGRGSRHSCCATRLGCRFPTSPVPGSNPRS